MSGMTDFGPVNVAGLKVGEVEVIAEAGVCTREKYGKPSHE